MQWLVRRPVQNRWSVSCQPGTDGQPFVYRQTTDNHIDLSGTQRRTDNEG